MSLFRVQVLGLCMKNPGLYPHTRTKAEKNEGLWGDVASKGLRTCREDKGLGLHSNILFYGPLNTVSNECFLSGLEFSPSVVQGLKYRVLLLSCLER